MSAQKSFAAKEKGAVQHVLLNCWQMCRSKVTLAEDPSLERRQLASTAASELVRPGRPGAGRASPSEVLVNHVQQIIILTETVSPFLHASG